MVFLVASFFSRHFFHRVSSFQHHTTSQSRHPKHYSSIRKNFISAHMTPSILTTSLSTSTQVVEAPNFSDFEFKQLTLNNGMLLTIIRDGQSEKSSCCLAIAVGAKDDPIEFPGMAHFTGKH